MTTNKINSFILEYNIRPLTCVLAVVLIALVLAASTGGAA